MFDTRSASDEEVLEAIVRYARQEKAAAALQSVLLRELVRRYFVDISLAAQGTELPAHSSRGLMPRPKRDNDE